MKLLLASALMMAGLFAQATPTTAATSTSTDVFVMVGSDFVRPGLASKANLNIGIGHTFSFLKKNPFGDELTFSYTYENGGSGVFHSRIRLGYVEFEPQFEKR
jgi:hypothetical protein